jgi:hypothetical protein
MKLSWIGKSALAWLGVVLLAFVFSMFVTNIRFVRILVDDSQGMLLAVPFFFMLSVGLGVLAKKARFSPDMPKSPWILYGIGSYIMLACVILAFVMMFVSYTPASYTINSILTMIIYALPIIAFVFVFGGFALELLGDRIKNRFSVWWLPVLMIVVFWASTFLLDNDGFRYNDPGYMAILAGALLLPAMLCSIIIQKAKRESWSLSYWLIGSGFLTMFTVVSVFLVTYIYVGYTDFFMLSLGMMAMLALLVIGVDVRINSTNSNSSD